MKVVVWDNVNPADYAVGSKHTVDDGTLIVAWRDDKNVVLSDDGELHDMPPSVEIPAAHAAPATVEILPAVDAPIAAAELSHQGQP